MNHLKDDWPPIVRPLPPPPDPPMPPQKPSAWTTQKPTKPGFYFYREETEVYVCEVMRSGNKLFCVIADVHPNDGIDPRGLLDSMTGEWAGPLEVPQ